MEELGDYYNALGNNFKAKRVIKDQIQDNISEEELRECDWILNMREREDRGCISSL